MTSASPASRARFAKVVRTRPVDLGLACLLIGAEVEPDLDPGRWQGELDALAARVDRTAPPVPALRAVLGGFSGDASNYEELGSSLLHEVLRRRSGLPILLSVVWLEVARRCGIDAAGIGLPGHFVVRVGQEYVDPFSGGAPLSSPVADAPVPEAGTLPALAATGGNDEILRPREPEEILLRVLTNIRMWAGRAPDRTRVRLWAVELSLLLPHHVLDLRRERAALLVQLADFTGGAAELEAYAEAVEPADLDAAATARRHARLLRSRLN